MLLYHAASSCVYFFFSFSDLKVSVPGPIFFDREILDEISWEYSSKNTGRNICCATVAASCLLHVIDVDSGVFSNLVTSWYMEEMCVWWPSVLTRFRVSSPVLTCERYLYFFTLCVRARAHTCVHT